jgi:hypothetical protein
MNIDSVNNQSFLKTDSGQVKCLDITIEEKYLWLHIEVWGISCIYSWNKYSETGLSLAIHAQ